MRALGVIPARFGSTRFPGKPLVSLKGRPLIQWVIEAAQKSKKLSKVVVATDHEGIASAARQCGAQVVMTASDLPSGTDRVFAASQNELAEVVVNVQGDEPLIDPAHIDLLVSSFESSPRPQMATLGHPLSASEWQSPHSVKVVMDQQGHALYFSRFPIPYSRASAEDNNYSGVLKHIGMYAYSADFLKRFCQEPPALLEKAEALEQLRALYMGAKIKVLQVKSAYPGVDTPEDLQKLETILNK